MEKKNPAIDRKRQALLVLPLLIIPFLTLAFWALGGGSGDVASAASSAGLNVELPEARLKDGAGENKMSFYDAAEKDSAKVKKGREGDLSFQWKVEDSTRRVDTDKNSPSLYNPYPPAGTGYRDPNEEKVYRKLAELNQQLSAASSTPAANNPGAKRLNTPDVVLRKSADAEPVERTMPREESANGEDTEMHQLNAMMDKILDIQHPERLKERPGSPAPNSPAKRVDLPSPSANGTIVSSFGSGTREILPANSFYGLNRPVADTPENAIEAVVHERQTLVDGGTIKLRLVQDASINGERLPKGLFVFGTVSLNGERLTAEIVSVRVGSSLYPVRLTLFDLDGIQGISIPGALTRDVAKGSTDNAVQLLEMSSLDPSLKAQAASAGLGAVKTLLSKKAKLVRVSVKAGYKVLLKNSNSQ